MTYRGSLTFDLSGARFHSVVFLPVCLFCAREEEESLFFKASHFWLVITHRHSVCVCVCDPSTKTQSARKGVTCKKRGGGKATGLWGHFLQSGGRREAHCSLSVPAQGLLHVSRAYLFSGKCYLRKNKNRTPWHRNTDSPSLLPSSSPPPPHLLSSSSTTQTTTWSCRRFVF